MRQKRLISLLTVAAMTASMLANMAVLADDLDAEFEELPYEEELALTEDGAGFELFEDGGVYTADFKQLTGKDLSQDIQLDDYTMAHLTYEGTTVDENGVIHLTGSGTNNKYGAAISGGSYVQFTAPSDGKAVFVLNYANYFIDTNYKGYSSATVDLTAGQKLTIGSRASGRSTLTSITFTPSSGETEQPAATPTEAPNVTVAGAYTSPSTLWDFNSASPASSELKNIPYVTGSNEGSAPVMDGGAVKFPSGTTGTGTLTLDLEPAVNNNIEIEFDSAGHSANLGQQYIYFTVSNSEGDEILSLSAHPYSAADSYAGKNKLLICGEQAAVDSEIMSLFGAKTTHVKIKIDYNARKLEAAIGSSTFSGTIPAKTMKDLGQFKYWVTRNKTAGDRYITLDNLSVKEFTSTEPAAADESLAEYKSAAFGGVVSRVHAPEEKNLPLLIFLHSASRNGTENEGQLYQAQKLFDALKGRAVLAAPQTADKWDAAALKAYIDGAKAEYGTSETIVAGYAEGAAAAYALAQNGSADKIIPIAGTADISGKVNARVWAFGGFFDENTRIADIRKPVNALQLSGSDVRYTEYPTSGANILETVFTDSALTEWILNDIKDKREVDLVLFAGQSNMAGRGSADEAIKAAPGEGYEFHSITNPNLADGEVPYVLSTAAEPFGKNDNNSKIHDSGSNGVDRRSGDMAGALMKAYYAKTGVPIVGVQASRGGQGTSYFLSSDYKTDCEARYKAAADYLEKAGYTVRRKFVVWCQGENDAESTLNSNYKKNTLSIFDNMKALGMTDMFLVKIGHRNGDAAKDAQYKQINEWQQELADENENIYAVADLYTDEYFAQMRDQYHYYQPVYNSIGDTAGTAIAAIYAGEAVPTAAPKPTAEPTPTAAPAGEEFELVSRDASIDVSKMKSYGSNVYRIYKSDKSYEDVTAVNGIVAKPEGEAEVTIVPVYRFNYTNAAMDGYTTATNAYTAEAGYGLMSGDYKTNSSGSLPVEGRPLHVDLPQGRYDITVLRQNQTRCNILNDGVKIMTNDGVSSGNQNRPMTSALMYAPQVLNSDGSIDLTTGGVNGSSLRIATVEIVRVPERYKKQIVWIMGDSESANYYPVNSEGDDLESGKIMMTGFGMQLGRFLPDNRYRISNFGLPGSTAVTWYDSQFEHILNNMDTGDIAVIDFGINDGNKNIGVDTMKEKLREIITAVKAKGAQPILVSPIWNSKYQHKTYFTYSNNTNAMYEFAKECNVPCIDLNKGTMAYKDKAIADTGDADWVKHNYHVGDNLHQTQHTAVLVSAIIAGGMNKLGYSTTDYALTYKDILDFGDADGKTRGTESGVSRVYSIAALEDYITVDGDTDIVNPTDAPVPTDAPKPTYTPKPTDEPAQKDEISISGNMAEVNLDGVDKAVLIRAKHDAEGRLTAVNTYNLTFSNGRAVQEIKDLENGDELYVWNSLKDMQPKTDKKTVSGMKASEPTQAPTQAPVPTPAVLPTAKPTQAPSVTDEPVTVLYSENFENSSVGSNGGWTSPAGTMAIKNDTTDGIGNYQTVVSGKSGTCRSGYVEIANEIKQSFVFECDFKSTSNVNVSDLELLESKGSVYANHGRTSIGGAVFTMARPSKSNLYVINNDADDSGLTIDRYAAPPVVTKEISNNPWLHVKVIGDFDKHTVTAFITSLDGKTEYYHGRTDMIPKIKDDAKVDLQSFKCIHLLSPSTNCDTCIDNIVIRTARASELAQIYHSVKITSGAASFDRYVSDGESVVNIPDVSMYGKSFEGWTVSGDNKIYSTAELEKLPISSDCEISAKISDDYIEALSEISFKDFPAGNELAMGEDENTYGDNVISLNILGEQGTSLVTNADSRVNDYKIDWTFDGFRTLDGKPTGEIGSRYCDSYGLVEITQAAQNSVNFKLKKTSANYYGKVTAKVTYNGKQLEVTKPLVLLGDKSGTAILPRAGYTADFNKYESTMISYRVGTGNAAIDGWETSGSDGTYMDIKSDLTGQYLSLSRAASGGSSYVSNNIGNITGQTVFKQDVRFNGQTGAIEYGVGAKGVNTDISESRAFQLSFDGSAFSFNGSKLCSAASGTWYHTEITADPTTKKCRAEIFDMSGNSLGSSKTVDFGAYTSGMFYHIVLGTKTAGKSIDINNVNVYEAEIDAGTIAITAPDTLPIPESGSAAADLTVSAKTTEGADAIGLASWRVDDELAGGVSIESTGSASAKLTVTGDAPTGALPIRVTIGGKCKVKEIKLTGTKNSVAFTEAPAGIQLGDEGEYKYTAELRNGSAEKIDGVVTYSLANADGSALQASGVSIDSATGKLTVTASAQPQTIFVKAVSDGCTRLAKTVLYSLKFSFGTSAKSGYTQVTADDAYSASKGFGIEGAAANDESGITGSGMTFKVKLEKGRVYSVKANYKGTIRCERINSSFTGFERTLSSLGNDTYSVAVFGDDVMDITLDSGSRLASVEITPVTKSAAEKPDWWTIGDSTVQQNGSWGYTIASDKTTDLSKYPSLAVVVNGFHNSGKAGEQHKNFYTNGRLNSILTQINPNDVVSLSGMGTNDSSSTKEQFKEYDRIYVDAILDMGGRVILGSYTPTGNYGATQGKVYDADNMMFKGMRTNAYDLAIRELYEEYKSTDGVLGFVDIGKMADDKMTADVKNAYDLASGSESDKKAAADARAEEMMAWWKDYNHYYATFSNYILPDLTDAVAELIK